MLKGFKNILIWRSEDIARVAADIGASSDMRQAILLGPPQRGVAGCSEVVAVYPRADSVAGVAVLLLGAGPDERPQAERDAAARQMFGKLLDALQPEFNRVLTFDTLAELAKAAHARWPCVVTDGLFAYQQQRRHRVRTAAEIRAAAQEKR
jgi:hypothetical protein